MVVGSNPTGGAKNKGDIMATVDKESNRMEYVQSFETMQKFLIDDSDMAWAWHCVIAMSFFDEGATHEQANKGSARAMKIVFGIDMTTFPQWKAFEWAQTA